MPSHYSEDELIGIQQMDRMLEQLGTKLEPIIANVTKNYQEKKDSEKQNIENQEDDHRWWKGLALESAIGVGTDIITAPLLASPIPGSRPLYYGLNYGIGYGTNVVAQKLRGKLNISQGEAHAAGAFQTIPLGTTLKGMKGLKRAVGKGAVGGTLGRQVEVGIDEGRLLTPEEALTSAGIGGTFGGATKGVSILGSDLKNKLINQIQSDPYSKLRPLSNRLRLTETGTVGAMRTPDPGKPQDWQLMLPLKQGYVPPDASQIWDTNQKLLKYSGLLGVGTRFNINAYRNILNSAQGRQVAMLYSTTPHTGIATTWDKHRQGLVDAFESVYGDAMQQLQIPRSRIEIEHIFTLQQSMPIYDGLSFGDPMFNKVQQAILQRGYKPGNAADNLMAIPQWIHGQKTNYFNILHGKDGRGFFTRTTVRKFSKAKGWTQKQADAFRLKTLERYLDEIDKGKTILDEGMKVFDTLHGRPRLPEELVEELADIELHRYSAPELKSIVKDIVTEFDAKPLAKMTKKEFMEYLHRLDESGDMLKDLSHPEQVRRLKEITGMSFEEIDTRMQAGWFTDLEGF